MFRVDWTNPKTTIDQVDQVVGANLVGIYDGLLVENGFLYVKTTVPMTADQENNVLSLIYKLNDQPTKIAIQSQPPQSAFAAKTITLADGSVKNLFKRFTGISQEVAAGSNTFTWTQENYPWVKFLGIEVIGAELGDTCDLFVLDTATGTYSGHANYPLNQFAFNANIAANYSKYVSEYDSDLYQNLQLKFVYKSASDKTIYINFNMNEVK